MQYPNMELVQVPVQDIQRGSPCKGCFPDVPKPEHARKYCKTCRSSGPCKHNGGVLVEYIAHSWTWPDLVGDRKVVDYGLKQPEDGDSL